MTIKSDAGDGLLIVVPGSLILAPLVWWIAHRNRGPARVA